MEEIKLSKQLVQDIINYLQTKPYLEVFQLISSIMQQANKQHVENEISKEQ